MQAPVADKISEVLSGREHEDAFFVIDTSALRAQYDLWKQNLPSVTPHYAVKCNDRPEILKLLIEWGAHFDCASAAEVRHVLELGAQASQIIYANPVKAPSQLGYATTHGVKRMTFDNLHELEKIKRVAPESELLLRIKTDDSAAICSLSCKFGASLVQTEDLLAHAQKLGLNVVGVAYHVGSGGGGGPAVHHHALVDALEVFERAAKFGHALRVLDIGGGFEPEKAQFEAVALEINRSLKTLNFPSHIEIMGEPGRFFAAPVMTLVVNIIGVRDAPQNEAEDMVYLTDGVYGNMNCIIYDHQNPKAYLVGTTSTKAADGTSQYASLWGPTCDGLDKVDSGREFPRRLRAGDWLYFPDAGAYTTVGESSFNGFNTRTEFHVV